jgi:hypothetical protein
MEMPNLQETCIPRRSAPLWSDISSFFEATFSKNAVLNTACVGPEGPTYEYKNTKTGMRILPP